MIKEHQFWFQQWQPVNVTVAAAVWSASYNLTGAPAIWTKGQTRSVTVTVTNTETSHGRPGYYRVDLIRTSRRSPLGPRTVPPG